MIDPGDLRDVFDRAASLPQQDRAAFLARACGDNVALRQEVERLLAADQRAGSVFDSGSSGSDSSAERGPAARDDTSALKSGARLGPYVILGPAGRGGMGEVYRARDTRLDRTVALKVLPSDLVQDAAARRRFEREARAAAALSHPHICTLLDIGRQDETDFIVMEFVDGDTLAHRLARETPPLRESLRIGIEIAEALVAAHAAHIVHRDIKPGNAMLRPDGFVKVLDFGLAKLTLQIPSDGGDTTRALSTRAGLIVGTVAYMSPEQARGQDVDARTDVWSLGCVLYELAAGRTPFAGTSTTDVLAAILQSDPIPLPVIDATIPGEFQRIVAKALKKDRTERYQTAQDLLIDLNALREELPRTGSGSGGTRQPPSSQPLAPAIGNRRRALASGAAVVLLAATAAAWWRLHATTEQPSVSSAPVQRALTRLTFDSGTQMDPTFSPDGRFIAYASDKAGNFDIWVQPIAGGNAVQVTKSPAQDTQPVWSPDGSTLVFRSERDGGGLYVVPALGGSERLVAARGSNPSWSPDGSEVRFIASSLFQQITASLQAVSLRTGETHRILPGFTDEGNWFWVAPHPDGRFSFLGFRKKLGFGFFTVSDDGAVTKSEFAPRLPPQLSRFTDGNWNTYGRHFRWSPDGARLVLETVDDGGVSNLWGIDVDPGTLEWKRFQRLTTGQGADVATAFSPDGKRLAFGSLHVTNRIWQFPLSANGLNAADGQPLTEDSSDASYLSVAPGGNSITYNLQRLGSADPATLWLKHLDSGASESLGTGGSSSRLSPDGRRVAYSIFQAGRGYAVFVQELGKAEHQVTPWSRGWVAACDWSRDGSAVLVSAGDLELWDAAGGEPKPRVVVRPQQSGLFQAKYSPNGRWLAFVSASGRGANDRNQVVVTSAEGLPDRPWLDLVPDHKFADKPRWSTDGTMLYFLADEGILLNLWAVRFDPSVGKPVGRPFVVAKFDSPSFKIDPEISFTEMDVSRKFVFLTMRAVTGNIWMLDNVDR